MRVLLFFGLFFFFLGILVVVKFVVELFVLFVFVKDLGV